MIDINRAFTLLELIIVIIIIGVLATLGYTQYTRTVERGRSAEAKLILGELRTAEIAYKLEYGSYTSLGNLPVTAPTSCTTTHYYKYGINLAEPAYVWCDRCTSEGKPPNSAGSYTLRLGLTSGSWADSDPGYW